SSGRWDTAQGYGEVWYPKVPAGWVPYADGRWVWIVPWGWTWVDAESWGFAPCHYGRWALIGESWAWVPGAFEPFPVYAPALIGFLGGSGLRSAGFRSLPARSIGRATPPIRATFADSIRPMWRISTEFTSRGMGGLPQTSPARCLSTAGS